MFIIGSLLFGFGLTGLLQTENVVFVLPTWLSHGIMTVGGTLILLSWDITPSDGIED